MFGSSDHVVCSRLQEFFLYLAKAFQDSDDSIEESKIETEVNKRMRFSCEGSTCFTAAEVGQCISNLEDSGRVMVGDGVVYKIV